MCSFISFCTKNSDDGGRYQDCTYSAAAGWYCKVVLCAMVESYDLTLICLHVQLIKKYQREYVSIQIEIAGGVLFVKYINNYG